MSIRTERVAKLLQRDIADVLNKEFDQQLMVTVTGVRVTKDLSIAYTYLSVMGATPEQRQATFMHIREQTPQIRSALANRIRHQVRIIPEIRFFLDESLEEAQHMESIFDRIRAERARRGVDEEDEIGLDEE